MRRIGFYIGIMVLTAVLFGSCQSDIEEILLPVERCSDAPVAITSSASFSINGKGYVFGGRTSTEKVTNHLYEYDPVTDSWTDLGATPLKKRVRPRAVAVNEDVYMGLGFNGLFFIDSAYLADFWKWTPAANTWTPLENYPSERTVGPVLSSDGENIYAAMGGLRNFERWIFRYNIDANQWVQLKDGVPRMASYPPRAHSACGAWCQDMLLLGAGYTRDGSSDFWVEAEIREDSIIWHRRATISGKRDNSTAVSDGKSVYLAGGTLYGGTLTNGRYYDDVLRYDPQKDTWTRIAHLPDGERENMISWVIGGYLYVGLGNDKRNTPCKQLYRIRL